MSRTFVLSCDPSTLPPFDARGASFQMRWVDSSLFTGFADEARNAQGVTLGELEQRQRMCEEGVCDLFCSFDEAGAPLFALWLINESSLPDLRRATSGHVADLSNEETLVAGGWTFAAARRRGAMRAGVRQVVETAGRRGSRRCFTYVAVENVGSLRGCNQVGFEVYDMRVTHTPHDCSRVEYRPPTAEEIDVWSRATS